VRSWREAGIVDEWKGRFVRIEDGRRTPVARDTRRYVGVPEMNAVAAHLARDLDVRSGQHVSGLARQGTRWNLEGDPADEGPFDHVVVSVPAPQAVPLLEAAPDLRDRVARVRMSSCWALMLGFPSEFDVGFDGAFVESGPLSWIARNGSKPGRDSETWILHASPSWTERHLDADPEWVSSQLIEAFAEAAGTPTPQPTDQRVHRWRYSLPGEPLDTPCLFDGSSGITVCGDWCAGARIEGAFLSGSAAAGRVLGAIAHSAVPEQTALF
jgi:predicted NAD/FAD-dependent oxidoreductase